MSEILSLVQNILNTEKLFEKRILLGLSGGPDSLFLGEALVSLLPKGNLFVAHFDHALRTTSENDANFCETWAKEKSLAFTRERWSAPRDSEEAARNARREFLFKTAESLFADAIALGTHADDVAETIFHNFLRGTGPKGLIGSPVFDTQTRLFRPLQSVWKGEILTALAELKQSEPFPHFCMDETNADSRYTRNFLRNEVFPFLAKRFPNFRERIFRQAEIFRRQEEAVRFLAEDFTRTNREHIDRSLFSALPVALQSEVVRVYFSPRSLDFEQTELVRKFFLEGSSGKQIMLKGKRIFLSKKCGFVEEIP